MAARDLKAELLDREKDVEEKKVLGMLLIYKYIIFCFCWTEKQRKGLLPMGLTHE
jgi:hypothetical protein